MLRSLDQRVHPKIIFAVEASKAEGEVLGAERINEAEPRVTFVTTPGIPVYLVQVTVHNPSTVSLGWLLLVG